MTVSHVSHPVWVGTTVDVGGVANDDGTATGRLNRPAVARDQNLPPIMVHPAELDDALCLGVLDVGRPQSAHADGAARLPFAVDDALLQATARSSHVWAVSAASCCPTLPLLPACAA